MNIYKFIILIFTLLQLQGCAFVPFITKYNLSPKESPPINKKIEVALVLGGGGARGIAHVGVIESLVKNNIPIDLIVGTSAGSLIGALYADQGNIDSMKNSALKFKRSDILEISMSDVIGNAMNIRSGNNGQAAEKFLKQSIKAQDFNELKIPLVAVATDINNGKSVGLRSGKIAPAIRASCAIPGLFSPIELYGMLLVDGSVTSPLAVDIAKKYNPVIIIAVDVSEPLANSKVRNVIELVQRSANLTYYALSEEKGKHADFLIKPNLSGIGMFDDHHNDKIYQAGLNEANKYIEQIKAKLGQRKKSNKVKLSILGK